MGDEIYWSSPDLSSYNQPQLMSSTNMQGYRVPQTSSYLGVQRHSFGYNVPMQSAVQPCQSNTPEVAQNKGLLKKCCF